MCRGFQPNETERLKIKAFYLHLSFSTTQKILPDSLTLHFLPRINGASLEINGSSIRSDTPLFITMHRVVSAEKVMNRGVVYGSREKMKASEGSRFEIYLGDAKVLKGIFRKDEGENWKLECKCGLEGEEEVDFLKEAEVCVAVDGQAAAMINEKVEMVRRKKKRGRCFRGLEEIPEEREGSELELDVGGGGCCCCDECSGSRTITDGGDCETEVESEMENVKWAVDVGIWVMCLGVGYLVSKASCRKFRHASFF